MFSFFKRLKSGLSQCLQGLQTVCQKPLANPIQALKASTHLPVFIRNIVKTAGPLKVASRGSRAIISVTLTLSAIQILLAENKLDQFANEVCSLALGAAGASIGTLVGTLGGPIGMIIGAGVGGIIGGLIGDWAHGKIKEWLFTEGKDGVRPLDRIADKFRAATNLLRVVSEVIAIIVRGQAGVLGALLERWRRVGGLGSGPGFRGIQ